jgi:hypothetical protein
LNQFDGGLVTVMEESIDATAQEPFPWLDRAGLAALLAGTLILLITFFTSYSHVDIPAQGSIQVNQQIGISLLFAALAALFGEVKLASNGRCAAERDRIKQRIRAAEERNRAARQARIQARLAAAQCRFLLADSSLNRLQLSEILALLLEDLRLS